MPTSPRLAYEDALANLNKGGLQGSQLASAQENLRGSYTASPGATGTETTDLTKPPEQSYGIKHFDPTDSEADQTDTSGATAPAPAPEKSPYSDALDAYVKSLSHSSSYTETSKGIDNLDEATARGIHGTDNKVIPLEFITGQKKAIEQRGLDLRAPLEAKLKRIGEDEKGVQAGAKARLDYEKSLAGGDGFNLSPGQTRYNTKGEIVASAPKDAAAPKIIGSATAGYFTVDSEGNLHPLKAGTGGAGGGGVPSTSQIAAIKNTLATGVAPSGEKIGNGRGTDGYIDPYVYLTAFENWPGTASDFASKFPVLKNVNPESYNLLPEAIRPKTKAAARTI